METGRSDQGMATLTVRFSKQLLQMFATGAMTGLLLMIVWWLITKLFSRYTPASTYSVRKDIVKVPMFCGLCLIALRFMGSSWLAELFARLAKIWN